MTAIEEILTAGSPDPLVGVVSIPANLDTRAPCLVLLNSGMMHHVGTCNLSVRIARAAAAVGISSCRFDFSGIGDSRSRTFDGTHEEREVSEVREVLETLQGRLDISRFVLCGLCSGADASLTTAEVDDRVVGIVQIDPLMFRTRSWYYNHYYQRITDPGAWRRLGSA